VSLARTVGAMTVKALRTYLVECYTPGIDRAAVESAGARATAAAAQMRAEGHRVEYVQALFVSADEAVFHVFAADEPTAVREAVIRAGVAFERIVDAVEIGRPERTKRRGGGRDRRPIR
jgi:hypothetical protein